MKPKNPFRPFLASAIFVVSVSVASAQISQDHPDGLFLDGAGITTQNTYIAAWNPYVGARSVEVGAYTGGVHLFSGVDGSGSSLVDGGILLQGSPVSIMLSSNENMGPGQQDNADFNVFKGTAWPSGVPLLNINGYTGNTTFTNSNVIITGGTLTVGGSPVLTSASAVTAGYVNSSNFNSTLSAATPPTSSAWAAAFVPRGNVAPVGGPEGGLLALGTSIASGEKSFAAGVGSVAAATGAIALGSSNSASGQFSTAIGQNSVASGQWSVAMGNSANASANAYYAFAQGQNSTASWSYAFARGYNTVAGGLASNAMGYGASAKARGETAVGEYNLESTNSIPVAVNGFYGLFRVGNGNATTRSDALTVLRSGETTLTNKEWKAAVVAAPGNAATALADPASTTDSSGNALVVDGHTVLNGKVTMAVAQGDISMGDYQ